MKREKKRKIWLVVRWKGGKINSRNLNFCSISLKTGFELKPNTNVWMPMECRSN